MIIAYVRMERAEQVMRELHDAGAGGLSAYVVRGMSGEASTFLYSKRPFEPSHLPETLKIEVICDETSVDRIVELIARQAKTGAPGDGLIAIQTIDLVRKIREM
ncbi:MAG TPA: P-II family nitrogen regulator [Terriglobales bacterium]|nr:P-II family nitrogen regulator [Terriglobales bacterium]